MFGSQVSHFYLISSCSFVFLPFNVDPKLFIMGMFEMSTIRSRRRMSLDYERPACQPPSYSSQNLAARSMDSFDSDAMSPPSYAYRRLRTRSTPRPVSQVSQMTTASMDLSYPGLCPHCLIRHVYKSLKGRYQNRKNRTRL